MANLIDAPRSDRNDTKEPAASSRERIAALIEANDALRREVDRRDVDARRDQNLREVLERFLAQGQSLSAMLHAVVRCVERELNGAMCSILLLDESGRRLLRGAAPRLPDFFNRAVNGLEIGPEVGSCGAAAFTGRRVIAEDIQTHPYWKSARELAERAGLRSCWSEPIASSAGRVLGTFAIYHTRPHAPRVEDIGLISTAAYWAGIAIERARSEEALCQSEARLAEAQRIGRMGSWELDLVRARVAWSDEGRRLHGLIPGEHSCTQEALMERVAEGERDALRAALTRAIDEKGPLSHEFPVVWPDGQVRWLHSRGHATYDPAGNPVRFLGISLDITERKRSEELIRANTTVLEGVARVQRQFLVETDPHISFDQMLALLIEVTESAFGFIGQVLRQPDGKPILKTHAVTNIAWDAETRALYEQHARDGMEFHNLKNLIGTVITTGETVIANEPAHDPRSGGLPPGHPPLRAFLGIPFFHGEELIGMVGIANRAGGYDQRIVDNLEPMVATCSSLLYAHRLEQNRERTEAELREKGLRLRQMAEASDLVFWFRSIQPEKVLYVSPAFESLWGKSCEDLYRDPRLWLTAVHPEDVRRVQEAFECWIQDRVADFDVEYRIISPDGSVRWIWDHGVITSDERGEGFRASSLARDITKRKQAEEERNRLEAQMLHVQKLESLGTLAGGIAHDFNNLLTSILGHADLARLEMPDGAPGQRSICEVINGARRAAGLANQMLAYSGKGHFVVEPVSLSTLTEQMTELLGITISKKCVITYDLMADLPSIKADADQVRQIIMNLIVNASEAIGDQGGTIAVSTGVMHGDRTDPAETSFNEQRPEVRYVYLEVADDGSGMSEDTRAKIFDPFFTTKFTGRGLGLSAVLGIVRGHQGAITCDSTLGKGTTFRVRFPATAVPVKLPDRRGKEVKGWRSSGTVLIVDDEESVLRIVRKMLEQMGFTVLTAANGWEGVQVFRTEAERIRLVLLDLTMPHLGGVETFRELQRLRGDVKAILSSGYNEQTTASQFGGAGPAAFIQKPFCFEELMAVVRSVIGGESDGNDPTDG